MPSRSHVLTATSSARVESSPPETPMFSVVSGRQLLDPLGQPGALDLEDLGATAVQLRVARAGTNGVPGTNRSSPCIAHGDGERDRGGTAGR